MKYGQEHLIGIVTKEEFDECYRWAFGDDVGSLLIKDSPRAWNQRHSDLFKIQGSDSIKETTVKIGFAYMESKKNESQEVPAQGAG